MLLVLIIGGVMSSSSRRLLRSGAKWLDATILQWTGPVSYEVKMQTLTDLVHGDDTRIIRYQSPTTMTASPFAVEEDPDNCYPAFRDCVPAAAAVSKNTAASMISKNSPPRRYPQRIRKQPDRFQAS
ncbi:hypothetical protein MRX96_009812 [Rhipicephalus microplus]